MTDYGQAVLLGCRLSRSGFSGERVFRVILEDGTEHHVGVAPVAYCFDGNHAPLGADEPAQGHTMNGFVAGRLVSNGGDIVRIALPDGETIAVRRDQIQLLRARRATEYVPI